MRAGALLVNGGFRGGLAAVLAGAMAVPVGLAEIEGNPGADRDGDGAPDAWERKYGLDPGDPSDVILDTDGDGLANADEYFWCTNPLDPDTDGDALADGDEVYWFALHPALPDSDGDGLGDLEEVLMGLSPADGPGAGSGIGGVARPSIGALALVGRGLILSERKVPDSAPSSAPAGGRPSANAVEQALRMTASEREAFRRAVGEGNLRVNTDRSFDPANGLPTLDGSDESGEADWSPGRGAVYMVNYDRDAKLKASDGTPAFDAITFGLEGEELEENWEIESFRDSRDLAPLQLSPMPSLPAAAGVSFVLPGDDWGDFEAFHLYVLDRSVAGKTRYIPIWGARTVELDPELAVVRWKDVPIGRWVNPGAPGYRETRRDGAGNYRFALEGTLFPGMEEFTSEEVFDGTFKIALEVDYRGEVEEVDRVAFTVAGYPHLNVAPKGAADVLAFPGAVGFGANSQGGRGAPVFAITNTDDYNPNKGETPVAGSLRWALDAPVPKTVVFRLDEGEDGTIRLDAPIFVGRSALTIAGESAPGAGIALRRYGLATQGDHVIIRHLRSRPGDGSGSDNIDAFTVEGGDHVILDHLSGSWATDEVLTVTEAGRVTIQNCLITESLNRAGHGFGSLVRGSGEDGAGYTFFRNVWAHHLTRMPRIGSSSSGSRDPDGATFDFRNNAFINWGLEYCGYNFDNSGQGKVRANFVGNLYETGRDTSGTDLFREEAVQNRIHWSGNTLDGKTASPGQSIELNRAADALSLSDYVSDNAFPAPSVPDQAAGGDLRSSLLATSGAFPRDSVDRRVTTRPETGKIINGQGEVGSWPTLRAGKPAPDEDGDGLPDAWERARGLNPQDATDGALDPDGDGYTHLEVYLQSLADSQG